MADVFYLPDGKGGNCMTVKEGDLYRILEIGGARFEIRYGYYEELDRVGKYNDPIPIYPNFLENPQYNNEGYPFVTEMQDTCVYYDGCKTQEFCSACSYFQAEDDLIGTCRCPTMKNI